MHVGVVHGALGKELHEWRPPQVSDYVRIKGSGRYAPGQSEASAFNDFRVVLDELEKRFPGLRAVITPEHKVGRPAMPSFEVSRDSRIVKAINAAYRKVRGHDQPMGAITPPGYYGTDAAHLYREAGMEGIVCGPGGRYNTMADERVDIADYLDRVRILSADDPGCLRGRLRPGASVTNTGLTGVPGLFARNQDPLGAVWRIKTTAKWWLQGRSEITRKLGLAARLSTFGARPSTGAWRLPKAFVPFPRPLIT